jgi:hypothetical protein
MSKRLGEQVRAARLGRKLTLLQFRDAYRAAGGDIHPSMLGMLETGVREGDPQTWSGLWRFLGLPWAELYREWGLPLPNEAQGEDAEVVEISRAVSRLDSPRRQVVSRFVQSLDYIVGPLAVTDILDTNHEGTLKSAALPAQGVPHDRRGVGTADRPRTRGVVEAHAALQSEVAELSTGAPSSTDASGVAEGAT